VPVPTPIPRERVGTAGLTLIEVAVAVTVLAVALCAMASTVVTTGALNRGSHETALARKAAERMVDALRNTTFRDVFAVYDVDPGDDPGGPGTAPGSRFAVRGLTPLPGTPGGLTGEILFPSAGPILRENVADAAHGMPRDLNGDTAVDAADHAGDYLVLPVRVRVRWAGTGGERTVELATLLSEL